jgi:hypothetical protein
MVTKIDYPSDEKWSKWCTKLIKATQNDLKLLTLRKVLGLFCTRSGKTKLVLGIDETLMMWNNGLTTQKKTNEMLLAVHSLRSETVGVMFSALSTHLIANGGMLLSQAGVKNVPLGPLDTTNASKVLRRCLTDSKLAALAASSDMTPGDALNLLSVIVGGLPRALQFIVEVWPTSYSLISVIDKVSRKFSEKYDSLITKNVVKHAFFGTPLSDQTELMKWNKRSVTVGEALRQGVCECEKYAMMVQLWSFSLRLLCSRSRMITATMAKLSLYNCVAQ